MQYGGRGTTSIEGTLGLKVEDKFTKVFIPNSWQDRHQGLVSITLGILSPRVSFNYGFKLQSKTRVSI